MAGLTAQQIVTRACEIAKVPGFVVQGGQFLNMILGDLCQDYDFQAARRTSYFNMNPGLSAVVGAPVAGSGPYTLPADFLRCQDENAAWYPINGTPRRLQPVDLSKFDMLVQQIGLQSYPAILTIDMSPTDSVQQGQVAPGGPQAYVWPPPSGAFPVTLRYFCQMPDIATPETSSTVPWFPNQNYLITRLAGELMRIADDSRMASYLGPGPEGADGILLKYLKLVDDKSNRLQSVRLDTMRFGRGTSHLPMSKFVGWGS